MIAGLERGNVPVAIGKISLYALLVILGVATFFPLLWAVSTSLKTEENAIAIPPQWIPDPVRPENYTETWEMFPFERFYFNTALIAILGTVGAVLLSAMAGYALAKYRFRGSYALLIAIVATMMIPYWINLVPVYTILAKIGWLDTYHGLIIPRLARPFGIFLMRQYMLTVHSDYIDSGRVDGASEFSIFWRIVLPQCTPALAALSIFFFVADWNSFMWPLIVTSSLDMRTVTVGLSLLAGSPFRTAYAHQMAGATIGALPAIAVFLALQRYFTEGISLTGIKG